MHWFCIFLVLILGVFGSPAKESDESEEVRFSHSAMLDKRGAKSSVHPAVEKLRELKSMAPEDFLCDKNSNYHSIEGKCNNLKNPTWGAAFMTLTRELPAAYEDSKGCCSGLDSDGLHTDIFDGGPCFPIPIPSDDPYFKDCMPFQRSVSEPDEDGVYQQLNSITPVIDLSSVYGSSREKSDSLRKFRKGKLRLDEQKMLPQDNVTYCIMKPDSCPEACPNSGDARVNVFPGLTAMHLVFHREHNRLAGMLSKTHPDWTDEELFQEARSINIAQYQNIVYKEYVPRVIGDQVSRLFGLDGEASYDPTVNPSITNEFATAAYRFGHSQISDEVGFGPSGSSVPLYQTFFRPSYYCEKGSESHTQVLQSELQDEGSKVDLAFARSVRDLLFFNINGKNASTDLPARNIQRGRDHGLQAYQYYFAKAVEFFQEQGYDLEEFEFPSCFDVYESPEDVDLYIGGLIEPKVTGGVVGPTFAYLIGHQYQLLREGDRFFFDLTDSSARFAKDQVANIKETSFAGVLCRNGKMNKIQKEAFDLPDEGKNPMVKCKDIPDIDMSLF